MWTLLLLAVAPNEQMTRCIAAVHGDLISATAACQIPQGSIDIFDTSHQPLCENALNAGVQAGRSGAGAPALVRNSLIKEFDRQIAACRQPVVKEEPKILPMVNIWDD